jgi:Polysaccharide biosynthesis/export protein
MMSTSRLKWLLVPLAFGLGAGVGVAVDRQIRHRSADAAARATLAAAEALAQPPVTEPSDSNVLLPSPGRSPFGDEGEPAQPQRKNSSAIPPLPPPHSPFDLKGAPDQPPAEMPEEPPVKVVPPVVASEGRGFGYELGPLPPGYFDLPAPNKNDGTDPSTVKPGQLIQVEVLEAMPGRPITGERVVRPDGTISLGFYGDLRVAGLNRDQIKVKLIEHLRKFLNDDVLGLIGMGENVVRAIPPVESSRVFVDESINYHPAGQEQAARPVVKADLPESPATNARVYELDKKLDRVLQELEQLRGGNRPAETPAKP